MSMREYVPYQGNPDIMAINPPLGAEYLDFEQDVLLYRAELKHSISKRNEMDALASGHRAVRTRPATADQVEG